MGSEFISNNDTTVNKTIDEASKAKMLERLAIIDSASKKERKKIFNNVKVILTKYILKAH